MSNIEQKKSSDFRMIAKTLFGLEEILKKELISIGADRVNMMNRSVEFYGDVKLLYKANIHCRLASRILLPIVSFQAHTEKKLYSAVKKVKWEDYFEVSRTIAVDTVVSHSTFDNSLYVAQLTKDAIVDRFRDLSGSRPSVDIKNPDIRINLHMHENKVTLSLDSSGEALFRRGYRKEGGRAPLNEMLAAGIIELTTWDKKTNLIDAMCGSGTFLIEAAMIARNIAPGIIRKKFTFMNWNGYSQPLYHQLLDAAKSDVISNIPFKIVGSDNNQGSIREAKANAKRAGVDADINFEVKDIRHQDPPPPPGILIINPPYGERISVEDIEKLYGEVGDSFKKNYDGYNAYVFTGNIKAAKKIGLRTSQKIKLFNGPIECRLLKFEMYTGSRKLKHQDNQ